MSEELTTKELFTELIKKLASGEIYLKIDDKTTTGSLYLVEKHSLPTVSIKIGGVYCRLVYRYDESWNDHWKNISQI